MARWFNTLYARIVGNLFVLLVMLLTLELAVMYFFWNRAADVTEQGAHWGLGGRIAAKMEPSLSGTVNYWGLQQVAKQFTDLNPYIDIYLVNAQGTVVADFADEGQLARRTIDLGPVRQFLGPDAKAHTPLLGDDPSGHRRRGPFSAAAIDLNGQPGFVYAFLTNRRHQRLTTLSREDSAFSGLLYASLVPLLGVVLLGVLVFGKLTRRFQHLIAAVGRYEGGDLGARPDITSSHGDELAALAVAVNRMMGSIAANIAALEDKDRLRRELIANLWHDLRGPVGTIDNLAELLFREQSGPGRDRLVVLRANVERLRRLLAELQELARLEAREVVPSFEPFSLADLVHEIALGFKLSAEERGVELRISEEAGLPLAAGDAVMIGRVLSNLMENAFRYTPRGGVVEVRLRPEGAGIAVGVADTGVGIPAADLPHVFERSYQAKAAAGVEHGCGGLGLAIVRKIVEAHHAEVRVESDEGRGTCFTFNLPRAARADRLVR